MKTCSITTLLVCAFAVNGFAQVQKDSVPPSPVAPAELQEMPVEEVILQEYIEEAPPSMDVYEVWEEVAAPPDEEKVYEVFDLQKQPGFPGGDEALKQFIADSLRYPPLAREYDIQGVVAIKFVIHPDGSITDVKVLKDIGGGCGKEAIRLVKSMPRWIPGEANGRPVKVHYTMRVRFRLD